MLSKHKKVLQMVLLMSTPMLTWKCRFFRDTRHARESKLETAYVEKSKDQ